MAKKPTKVVAETSGLNLRELAHSKPFPRIVTLPEHMKADVLGLEGFERRAPYPTSRDYDGYIYGAYICFADVDNPQVESLE